MPYWLFKLPKMLPIHATISLIRPDAPPPLDCCTVVVLLLEVVDLLVV